MRGIWREPGGVVERESGLLVGWSDFLLIPRCRTRSQWPATMGQQSNKIIKRRRRSDYLKRKKEQAKLGGIVKPAPVAKKAAPGAKAPAKKAAKKAPAKKAAKKAAPAKAPAADAPETAGE
ncbi:MAG: hypothetical protein V4733_04905 [Verrucomicrobiota bacterium]